MKIHYIYLPFNHVFDVLYAFIYCWLFIIPNYFILKIGPIEYLISDFLFEIILAISSFVSIYWLYNPCGKVLDFLKILQANNAVMYYEDVRVYRDKKNKTNRLNNCEQANMDKIIENATSQLEDIEVIEKNDGVVLLDDNTI